MSKHTSSGRKRAEGALLAALLLVAAGCASPGGEQHGGQGAGGPATLVDRLGLAFVLVPAGEFVMGSEESAGSLEAAFPTIGRERIAELHDEAPRHRVRITRDFYLARHEVTVGQFRRFVDTSGYVPESIADGTGAYGFRSDHDPARSPRGDAFEGRDPAYSWRNPGFPQGDDHPVVNVSWNDAMAMARWLSEIEGVRYRLPTEAEWEYACRAGSRTRYHWGDAPVPRTSAANLFDLDAAAHWPRWQAQALPTRDGFAFTAPVGSFAPNAWGLHDMHGNVWEWVADWYEEGYYRVSPLEDPGGPQDGRLKVRRGGSWHTWPFYARASFRNWNTPETRYTLVGFRLLREAGAVAAAH